VESSVGDTEFAIQQVELEEESDGGAVAVGLTFDGTEHIIEPLHKGMGQALFPRGQGSRQMVLNRLRHVEPGAEDSCWVAPRHLARSRQRCPDNPLLRVVLEQDARCAPVRPTARTGVAPPRHFPAAAAQTAASSTRLGAGRARAPGVPVAISAPPYAAPPNPGDYTQEWAKITANKANNGHWHRHRLPQGSPHAW